jgi:thiosulfate dehydrogenase [quinone] large subunit
MQSFKHTETSALSRWVLLPLRLFLGITFIYAGFQKLTDPQFFDPTAIGYIGKQIQGYALSSPLRDLLLNVVEPRAVLFGLLIAYGEIAVGLGALFGFLARPAALFGLLLSTTFFLTASWGIYPYFYGADIVFMCCWLTFLINGIGNTGLPSLDEQFALSFVQRAPTIQSKQQRERLLRALLGVPLPGTFVLETDKTRLQSTTGKSPSLLIRPPFDNQSGSTGSLSTLPGAFRATPQSPDLTSQKSRRLFLLGAFAGVAATLVTTAAAYAVTVLGSPKKVPVTQGTGTARAQTPSATAGNTPGAASPTATSSTPASTATQIALVDSVPVNSSITFTLPNVSSDHHPGILIHLNDGQFVAFDTTCSHRGCQVDYDPTSSILACPCHGAEYDPANQAAVIHPPAPNPLTAVAIHVDSATGAITLANA